MTTIPDPAPRLMAVIVDIVLAIVGLASGMAALANGDALGAFASGGVAGVWTAWAIVDIRDRCRAALSTEPR